MTNLGLKPELRDGETIRAYLEELVRLKSPVQLWLAQSDQTPFETTLEQVLANTFSTATTPPLEPGQVLNLSFMLEARRFITYTKVVGTGVFGIPLSIAQGERRDRLRATFDRGDAADAFAVEFLHGSILTGRVLQGRLMDLSLQGLRVALDDTGALTGGNPGLKRGDSFACVCINNLPHTPTIQCSGIVAHVTPMPGGLCAGMLLNGLSEGDQKNITRILARRFPATFGQAFPAKKRKTDIADKAGAPTATQVKAKVAEVVALPAKPAPEAARTPHPEVPAVIRLRKLGKKILLLSGSQESPHPLAESFRADGYRQVFQAKTFLEASALAKRIRFDLVLLDMKVGGHWAKEMMEALRNHDLLVSTPLILVADYRNESAEAVGEALEAVHIHERRESYEELLPWLHGLMLEENG